MLLSSNTYCQVNYYLHPKIEVCLNNFDKNEFAKYFNNVKIDSNYLLDVTEIEKIELLKLCNQKNINPLKEAGDISGFEISIFYIDNETAIKGLIKILNAFRDPEFIIENKLFTFFKPGLYISRTNEIINIYRVNSGVFDEDKLQINFKLNNLKFDEGYYLSHNIYYKFPNKGGKKKAITNKK